MILGNEGPLPHCFLDFSVGIGAFVIGLSQISSFSLDGKSATGGGALGLTGIP